MEGGSRAEFYDRRTGAYPLGRWTDNVHTRILERVGTGRRVLDAGCATGELGAAIRALGNEVHGIDIAPAAVEAARSRLDSAAVADLESGSIPVARESCDVAVCADVLEHLFEPERALAAVVAAVRPGGELLVSLPNVAHFTVRLALLAGRWDYEEVGLLDRGHVRFFTRASAERLLGRAGLRIEAVDAVLSVPNASPWTRRAVRLARALPAEWREEWSGLLAAQFLFAARRP